MALPAAQPRFMSIENFQTLAQQELAIPLKPDQRGFLFLDFDHTIAEPRLPLISDLFLNFLDSLHQTLGIKEFPHGQWFQTLKALYMPHAKHQPTDEKVRLVIERFKEAGWNIRMVTNRAERHRKVTMKQMKSAGISIPNEHCNFRDLNSSDTKGDRILRLIGDPKEGDRIVFVDDDSDNLHHFIEKVNGTPYEYIQRPFSKEEKDVLAVELHCHKHRQPIPSRVPSNEVLVEALRALKIDESDETSYAQTFLMACLEISELDCPK